MVTKMLQARHKDVILGVPFPVCLLDSKKEKTKMCPI